MSKEVIRKVCILIGICCLVFITRTTLHIRQNNFNQLKVTNTVVDSIKEKKPVLEKQSVTIKTTNIKTTKTISKDNQIAYNQPSEKQTVKLRTNRTISRGSLVEYDTTFELTFYSGLVCENSKYGAVTHKGLKLFDGVVANNVLPYATKIKLKGFGTVQVLDIGGGNFNSSRRLDVYVPRLEGESDDRYYNRVQNMGRVKVQGKIIK